MAFSKRSREEIKRRANYKPEIVGVEILTGELMQCAHVSHKRKTGYYNCPSNGFYASVSDHLVDHILREGQNGLTRTQNYYAILGLTQQIISIYGKSRLVTIHKYADSMSSSKWVAMIAQINGIALSHVS